MISPLFTVYILQSLKDGKIYIGYTNNFNRRFQQHNNGLVRSTKYRTPFKLLFKEEFKEAYKAKKTRIMVEKWRW